jgi:hypothetical protein
MISQSEKTNPISEMPKMNANTYIIEDYENETTFRPQKNKPKQTQFPYIDAPTPIFSSNTRFCPSIHDKTSALTSIIGRKIFAFPNKVFAKKRRENTG